MTAFYLLALAWLVAGAIVSSHVTAPVEQPPPREPPQPGERPLDDEYFE